MTDTSMMPLTDSEKEVLQTLLDENKGQADDSVPEEAEAEQASDEEQEEQEKQASEDTKPEDADHEKEEEPVEYEVQSVFSGQDSTQQVVQAIEMNKAELGKLKGQFDAGNLSEEEFEAKGREIASTIERAQAHLDAVAAYRAESFKTQVEEYCEQHKAVIQKKTVYDAWAGTTNRLFDELQAKGETPSMTRVMDLARLAVENDLQCDLSGDRILFNRPEVAATEVKKTPEEAAKAAIKREAEKSTPPDVGQYPSAQGPIDKTQFELLNELADSDPVKFQAEMAKLPKNVMDAYLVYVPDSSSYKAIQS